MVPNLWHDIGFMNIRHRNFALIYWSTYDVGGLFVLYYDIEISPISETPILKKSNVGNFDIGVDVLQY